MRNIGSVEVTGSIPVSSSEMVENKDFSRKLLFEMSLFFYYPNQWFFSIHYLFWGNKFVVLDWNHTSVRSSRSFPFSVKEYSTWSGISLNCILDTNPSLSSSRKELVSMVFVIPSMFLQSSLKRIVINNTQFVDNLKLPFALQH